jgi:hypothetical protein
VPEYVGRSYPAASQNLIAKSWGSIPLCKNNGQKVQSNTTQGCKVYVLSNKPSRHVRNTSTCIPNMS